MAQELAGKLSLVTGAANGIGRAVAELFMINNAGLSDDDFGRLLDKDLAAFDRVLHVNLLGVMLGTQFAGHVMAKTGGGSIINTSSLGDVRAGYVLVEGAAGAANPINQIQEMLDAQVRAISG